MLHLGNAMILSMMSDTANDNCITIMDHGMMAWKTAQMLRLGLLNWKQNYRLPSAGVICGIMFPNPSKIVITSIIFLPSRLESSNTPLYTRH